MKKISAGIIIQNQHDEFLLGHSTGNHFFDIFKGGTEANETALDTALRECQEESGLILEPCNIIDLGIFSYNKEKDLHLFLCKVNKQSIDMTTLVCTTFVQQPTYSFPEMDRFAWFSYDKLLEYTATSMNKIFKKLAQENLINVKNLPDNYLDIPSSHQKIKMKGQQ